MNRRDPLSNGLSGLMRNFTLYKAACFKSKYNGLAKLELHQTAPV